MGATYSQPQETTEAVIMPPVNHSIGGRVSTGADVSERLLKTLESSLEDLRSLVTCRICIKLLYEPYTIQCGHTFCYSCLAQWFRAHNVNKTCPDCRAGVRQQPAPAYMVREMTNIFISRAELLPTGETTADHKRWQQEEISIIESDRSNTDQRSGGLFRGCFRHNRPYRQPITDQEDGVTRCPTCAWELEDGYCDACQVAYGPDGEAYSADDLDYSTGDSIYDFETHSVDGSGLDYDAASTALLNTDSDISLDGDGHSLHGHGDTSHGGFNIGRAAAQHVFSHHTSRDRPRGDPRGASARRQTSLAITDSDTSSLASLDSIDDGATNSLDGFLAGDDSDEENGASISPGSSSASTASIPVRNIRRDTFSPGSRNSPSGIRSGNTTSPVNIDSSDSGSEEGGAITNGRRRRQRHASSAGPRSLAGGPSPTWVSDADLSTSTSGASSRHRRHPNERHPIANHQRALEAVQGSQNGPIEVPSDSDSAMPSRRTRRQRPVVNEASTDDSIDSDSNLNVTNLPGNSSSSGSATLGSHSPIPISAEEQPLRRDRDHYSPILVSSSPSRPQNFNGSGYSHHRMTPTLDSIYQRELQRTGVATRPYRGAVSISGPSTTNIPVERQPDSRRRRKRNWRRRSDIHNAREAIDLRGGETSAAAQSRHGGLLGVAARPGFNPFANYMGS